jgi:putative copper resistance protein D
MEPVSGWDIAALLAKAVTYAATLSAAGCVFFVAYSDDLLQNQERSRIRRLLGASLAAAAIASAATTLLLAASMGGDIGSMFDATFIGMLLRAGQGRATAIRLAGLMCALFALSTARRFQVPAIIGAILAATSFAWVGHIHALRPNALPTFILCLHLLGGAFWLGALTPLLIVARAGNGAQIGAIAARFGTAALGVVSALIAAGAILLWLLIDDAAKFWSSDYGWMLAGKLATVAVLLSIAALNKLNLTPRLLRGDSSAVGSLKRSITVEMVLGGTVLLITAAFTTITGPPH